MIVAAGASVAHRFTAGVSVQVGSGMNSASLMSLYGYQPPLRLLYWRIAARPSSKSEIVFSSDIWGGSGHTSTAPPSPVGVVVLALSHPSAKAAEAPKVRIK